MAPLRRQYAKLATHHHPNPTQHPTQKLLKCNCHTTIHTAHTNHTDSDSPQHFKQSYEKYFGWQGGLGVTTFENVALDFLSILNSRENTHHHIISRGRIGDPNKSIYFVATITSIISICDLLESVQWLGRYSTLVSCGWHHPYSTRWPI